MSLPPWLSQLLPIVILLGAIGLVLSRLPKVDVGHSDAFRRRRFFNWFPLGLTYAFLYMGRYNLNVATTAMGAQTSNADFATIFTWGTAVYGAAFLLNGPLTDKLGGRFTILLAAGGAAAANVAMGVLVQAVLGGWSPPGGLVAWLSGLYAVNMYFQSFGAVSIVKVNASWFHLRERGQLGGVFGILISLGLYFAYDWCRFITTVAPVQWVFYVPAGLLMAFLVMDAFVIRDLPSQAGFQDFDTADAGSADTGAKLSVGQVFGKVLSNRVILIILGVEFCSGFLRNAVLQWFPKYAKAVGEGGGFVASNWGMLSCVAGILGGMFAGVISDRVFDSRRGPVSAVLYGGLLLGALGAVFLLGTPGAGWSVVFMSLCVIGVHGMLSGTATMDFGGKKNTGVVVGIIDGAVYAGTAIHGLVYGFILPTGDAMKDPMNWKPWPLAMLPLAVVGLVLATRVWNAKPQSKAAAPLPVGDVVPGAVPGASSRTGTNG